VDVGGDDVHLRRLGGRILRQARLETDEVDEPVEQCWARPASRRTSITCSSSRATMPSTIASA
jgi:hypothetical protein